MLGAPCGHLPGCLHIHAETGKDEDLCVRATLYWRYVMLKFIKNLNLTLYWTRLTYVRSSMRSSPCTWYTYWSWEWRGFVFVPSSVHVQTWNICYPCFKRLSRLTPWGSPQGKALQISLEAIASVRVIEA